jgi:hypothetical protein
MKFRITQGVNSIDGNPIFYVYKSIVNDAWTYVHGASKEEDARAFVERQLNKVAEKVIAEIEG